MRSVSQKPRDFLPATSWPFFNLPESFNAYVNEVAFAFFNTIVHVAKGSANWLDGSSRVKSMTTRPAALPFVAAIPRILGTGIVTTACNLTSLTVIPSLRNSALYSNSPSAPGTVTQGLAQAVSSSSMSTRFSSAIAGGHTATNNEHVRTTALATIDPITKFIEGASSKSSNIDSISNRSASEEETV